MKTYTQDQYNKAKLRAYKKGYKDAQEEITIDEAWENADQVKDYQKYNLDSSKTLNFVAMVVVVVILLAVFLSSQAEVINNLI